MSRLPVLTLLVALAAGSAAAEERPAGRYVFVPAEAGTLRLDTATGEVSLCAGDAADLGCRVLPDEARAGEAEAALEERIAALEARMSALEAESRAASDTLPDEETMDRVMVLADRMMRRFFSMVRDIKRDMESGEL
jgi:hypothetical protein